MRGIDVVVVVSDVAVVVCVNVGGGSVEIELKIETGSLHECVEQILLFMNS